MRRWQVLLVAGLAGVASLLLVPFEALVTSSIPPFGLRALAAVQPAIFAALAVLIGEATARRVGLRAPLVDAWIAGDPVGPVLHRQFGPAMAVGVIVAATLTVYAVTVGQSPVRGAGANAKLVAFDLPLMTKLLYGGITEELLTRWALVSLFAWVGWRIAGRGTKPSAVTFAVAVLLASLFFAAGHLPLLFLIAPNPSALAVFAVLAGNVVPGLLFGWLYVRQGLEAAVLAHMTGHS